MIAQIEDQQPQYYLDHAIEALRPAFEYFTRRLCRGEFENLRSIYRVVSLFHPFWFRFQAVTDELVHTLLDIPIVSRLHIGKAEIKTELQRYHTLSLQVTTKVAPSELLKCWIDKKIQFCLLFQIFKMFCLLQPSSASCEGFSPSCNALLTKEKHPCQTIYLLV